MIVLVQRVEDEDDLFPNWSIVTKHALSCLSDAATRVLVLKPALLELKDTNPLKYHRLYFPDGHMTAEGNHFVPSKSPNFLAKGGRAQLDRSGVFNGTLTEHKISICADDNRRCPDNIGL